MNAIAQVSARRPSLTYECPTCEDGTIWGSRFGGNDPDTWAVPCDECDGSGIKTWLCDAPTCNAESVEWFQGETFCEHCVAEQKRDALWVGED